MGTKRKESGIRVHRECSGTTGIPLFVQQRGATVLRIAFTVQCRECAGSRSRGFKRTKRLMRTFNQHQTCCSRAGTAILLYTLKLSSSPHTAGRGGRGPSWLTRSSGWRRQQSARHARRARKTLKALQTAAAPGRPWPYTSPCRGRAMALWPCGALGHPGHKQEAEGRCYPSWPRAAHSAAHGAAHGAACGWNLVQVENELGVLLVEQGEQGLLKGGTRGARPRRGGPRSQ